MRLAAVAVGQREREQTGRVGGGNDAVAQRRADLLGVDVDDENEPPTLMR